MLLVRSVQSVREISSQRQEHSTGGVCAPQLLCRPLSSTTKMALASRQPSAATSTAPTPSRRRTVWRSSCATPTSSATLSAGGCRRRASTRSSAAVWRQCSLVSPRWQGSAVSSRGLVEDEPEQRQHHVANHPAQRPGGAAGPGGRRLHATGQTDSHLTASVHGRQDQSVAGSLLTFLLKCLETQLFVLFF